MNRVFFLGRVFFLAPAVFMAAVSAAFGQTPIDFDRDIRPILSDTCFKCHGPDEQQRKADLRLDTQQGLYRNENNVSVVVPKQPKDSELVRRITSMDPEDRMPPIESRLNLKPAQISLIQRWIEQGAEWKQHWSFAPPIRPAAPKTKHDKWVGNPIDAFIARRLQDEGWAPSQPADSSTLLRRVAFDLTGLPPTRKELTRFKVDIQFTSVNEALAKAVDRYLATPQYAERMAIRWLDAARYADTSGYQSDGTRVMWRWRDWVIEAFHTNMPFDQFTIEQLAGDLLPNATRNQILATAFSRNHRGNAEGGIVPEEFQVEYVVDRVDTTATVWLGLTIGCARCHSHKYDPISHREYYQLFSYFNNIPEYGRALKEGNSPPWMKAPTKQQERQLADLTLKLERARRLFKKRMLTIPDDIAAWEALNRPRASDGSLPGVIELNTWTIVEGLAAKASLDPVNPDVFSNPVFNETIKGKKPSSESVPVKIEVSRLEVPKSIKTVELTFPNGEKGRVWDLDGKTFLEAGKFAKFGYFDKFSLGAWVFRSQEKPGTVVSKMELIDRGAGYNLHISEDGKLQLNLVKRWLDDSLRVESIERIPTGQWVHLFATYDGSRVADGITLYVNGTAVQHRSNLDGINQSFANDEPLRFGAGNSNFVGSIRDAAVFARELPHDEIAVLAELELITGIRKIKPQQRTRRQTHKLTRYFLEVAGDDLLRKSWQQLKLLKRQHAQLLEDIPSVMVMDEMPVPRQSYILTRGEYNRPGEKVQPGTPSALNPLPKDAPANRLGLARWLVDRNNPLTARVTINRLWRDLFGNGIVKTPEDFGAQGARPVHPELLDWLAVEFMESGWDIKHMMKLMILSNTYRQSSNITADHLKRDPENRLLARGPRFRLPAEMIRDQALAVSGLLTKKIGGRSVKPYQPAGLWKEIASDTDYQQEKGDDLYRRSLYTFWKRTVAPPMMMTFDASGREMCEVRQIRTNTPLQALSLLNDVTFVEAARVLAQRIITEESEDAKRLVLVYETVLCREPSKRETEILTASADFYRQRFTQSIKNAQALVTTGDSEVPEKLDPVELATWTTICSTVLNLDETVTKE
jgi:hypothetical protein